MTNLQLFLAMSALAALAGPLGAQNGSISGVVRTEDGQPVAGATVTCWRRLDLRRDFRGRLQPDISTAASATVATGATGAFNITGLPAGLYYFCATRQTRPRC